MKEILFVKLLLLSCLVNLISSSVSNDPEPVYENSDVLILKDSTFNDLIGINLVEFYAPWCGFCKKLSPIYEELATKLKKESPEITIRLAKVDCTVEKATCERFDVGSYPTLKMIDSSKKIIYEYKGDRSLDDLTKFIKGGYLNANSEKLPRDPSVKVEGSFKVLSDSNFTDTITSGGRWLVYYYIPTCRYCKQYGPKFESVAIDNFERGYNFAEINCEENPEICELYQITGYPTFKYIEDGRFYDFYQEPTHENLEFFIQYGAKMSPGKSLPWNLIFSLVEEAIREFVWLFIGVSFIFGLSMGYIFFGMSSTPSTPTPTQSKPSETVNNTKNTPKPETKKNK